MKRLPFWGGAHNSQKHLGRGAFFCVVFPIQGTRAPLTLNSPFTVFEKRGFQKPSSGGFDSLFDNLNRMIVLCNKKRR